VQTWQKGADLRRRVLTWQKGANLAEGAKPALLKILRARQTQEAKVRKPRSRSQLLGFLTILLSLSRIMTCSFQPSQDHGFPTLSTETRRVLLEHFQRFDMELGCAVAVRRRHQEAASTDDFAFCESLDARVADQRHATAVRIFAVR